MKHLSNCCNADIEQDLSPQEVYRLRLMFCSKCRKNCGYERVVPDNSYCDQCTSNSPHTHSAFKIVTESENMNGSLTPLDEAPQKNCPRCNMRWIAHNCPHEK